jgi:phosphate starvation-inducible PhoH-like protein
MARAQKTRAKSKAGRAKAKPVEDRQRGPEGNPPILAPLEPKSVGQEIFIRAIEDYPIVICDGVAGTGKTLISFGSALRAYLCGGEIERIIIVRPTFTSSDEPELGFLPGTLDEKMAPFVAPLLKDSAPLLFKKPNRNAGEQKFIDRFGNGRDNTLNMLSKIDIEIIPLHMMRGRSLHSSFIILDEAQNCSKADFKLFLTRIGRNSRVIIEGDSTQKDRPDGDLPSLMKKLQVLNFVGVVRLTQDDIVRNDMIADIIDCLDE